VTLMETHTAQINNMFLIGAGFTRAVFPNAPLNKDLLAVLCKGSACTTLSKYSRKYKSKDIEILLTHLDLEILRPKARQQTALRKVRNDIGQQLAQYFGQFRFEKEILKRSGWLEQLVKLFNENDAIITLNYDCFLDGLLDYYEVWSPSKGYGAVEVDVPDASFSNLPNPKNILIYKIHGSENFHTSAVQSDHVDPRHIGLAVEEGRIYPKSGTGSKLGVLAGRPYIIAPSFLKVFYPQTNRMMNEALRAAVLARNFVIIGSSLRPEDSHLWLLIDNFCQQSSRNNRKKLIIMDPHADDIQSRLEENYPQIEKRVDIDVIKRCLLEESLEVLTGKLDGRNGIHCHRELK